MHFIVLDQETDFDGWRRAARALVLGNIAPADITWSVRGNDADLFASEASDLPEAPRGAFSISARFIELAKSAILLRDPQRFALLYRVLWRLHANPDLIKVATDPDITRLRAAVKAVHRDQHKMKAFVRFREIGREPKSRFVAWFEPAHFIVEATAPFFARRFADMEWSILTPDASAHWDGRKVTIAPGVSKRDAPSEDRLEETWLTYYANIFNPARLKTKAMQSEMPKKYWKNLPEAALIKPLIEKAERNMTLMINADATEPKRMQRRPAGDKPVSAHGGDHNIDSIEALRAAAADCRACALWQDATQTVFGAGPINARVMMVGEQPGDKEDIAGVPFVGPAGQMLDRAMQEAGITRGEVYVTNAVKHFKFVPRGKIRLHQKPNTAEIRACRHWYQSERAAVKPELVVAMGATAAHSVLGKTTTISEVRGRLIDLDAGAKALVTVHPSYLLRLPDPAAKAREYAHFVDDLRIVAAHLTATMRATG